MTDNLAKAKEYLIKNNYTCVLCNDNKIYTSEQRGVKPLYLWVDSGINFNGYSAADKVIGKATAFLYVLLGVTEVYTNVISESALQVLTEYNIKVEYGSIVKNIINRQGNGICPFESAVLDINDVQKAYEIIKKRLTVNLF